MREIKIKVRGYHCDAFGHVNNARYLEFLEEARWSLFDPEGTSLPPVGLVVARIAIDYRRPSLLGEELAVRTALARLGAKSATLAQVIVRDKDTVAQAEVVMVAVDASGRAAPMEGVIKEALLGLLGEPLEK